MAVKALTRFVSRVGWEIVGMKPVVDLGASRKSGERVTAAAAIGEATAPTLRELANYYGDFVVYPILICGLAVAALWQAPPERYAIWAGLFIAGLWLWTLVEYLLHRYVLHHMPYVREMHQAHHDAQDALIGTPIWISLASFAVLLVLPLWFLTTPMITSGVTAGTMVGYLCFGGVHHVLHHWRIKPGSWSYRLRRRHMLHHHFDDDGNFGVTTGFWDVVFGTDVNVRRAAASRDLAN